MEEPSKEKSIFCKPYSNDDLLSESKDQTAFCDVASYSEPTTDHFVRNVAELSLTSVHDQELSTDFELSDNVAQKNNAEQNVEIFKEFEMFGETIEVDDSLFSKTKFLLRISNVTINLEPEEFFDEEVTSSREVPEPDSGILQSERPPLSVSTPRVPLTLADRDQLRAMIVLLNESNSVLLKIRQRFPLSASTRCDVIQCQIQMQLQELFGEFRSNDVNRFRDMIPQNRQTFLLIWDHLAQLIVDSCYHT